MTQTVWQERHADAHAVRSLCDELGISGLLAKLLVQRGVETPEKARMFLSPSLSRLDDPRHMLGMPAAVDRLIQAIEKKEKIFIYGDYDADGVTSISVLVLFFRRLGIEVDYLIPSRLDDGYGLHEKYVDEISGKGCRLLVTVDCGISNVSEVESAVRLGMDVIIVDHHQLAKELPPASAILNPCQPECRFPTRHLSAVGVCFNLLIALRTELRARGWFSSCEEPNLKEFLDLVCLGTIADVVPLTEENRIIATFGLQELGVSKRPGIAALKELSGLHAPKLEAGQVGFRLAPRINAVGRIGLASKAVDLLTTDSYSVALALAKEMDRANQQRQNIEQKILLEALEQLKALGKAARPTSLVMASDSWHVGVVGIVASRLVDRYNCPVVMLAFEGEYARGSARGTKNVHLYKALQKCVEHLEAFGGHRMAAGLKLQRDKLNEFRRAFDTAITGQLEGAQIDRVIEVDGELQPADLTLEIIDELKSLAPFGLGNPEPLFVARNLAVKSARLVGREPPYHLKAVLADEKCTYDMIGFGLGDRLDEMQEKIDVIYTASINNWNAGNSIQLRVRDIKSSRD